MAGVDFGLEPIGKLSWNHRMPAASTVQASSGLTALVINPLLSAVIETFDLALGSTARRGSLELRAERPTIYDVSAVISITGRVKGSVCLSFRRMTCLAIYERMLGEPAPFINAEVRDAVGETANMVTGSTKSKLEMGLNIGLPQVFAAEDFDLRFPSDATPMRLHFDSDIGPFVVDFGFVVQN